MTASNGGSRPGAGRALGWEPFAPFGHSFDCITVEQWGAAVRLTLDRPEKLNALNPQMRAELVSALGDIARRPDLSCVVVSAQGRAFSAGVDVDTPYFFNGVRDESVYAGTRLLTEQHEVISALFELPQVTVAAVQGDAVGGFGFGIAMACDLRIVCKAAKFWMIPSRLDVIQDFGLTWLLQRQIGPARTLELALRRKPLDAEEAYAFGMVNRVVADATVLEVEVDDLVACVAEAGPDSTRMLKAVVRAGARSELRDQLAVEAIANGLAFQSDSFRAKHSAYLDSIRDRSRGRTS